MVSTAELLEQVWDLHPETRTRACSAAVLRLRSKLEVDPSIPRHILTVWGRGVRFHAAHPALGEIGSSNAHD